MIRTQIQLTELHYERLREKAFQENTSMAELIRRGVEWILGNSASPRQRNAQKRRALAALGRFKDKTRDVSLHHDRYLEDAFKQ